MFVVEMKKRKEMKRKQRKELYNEQSQLHVNLIILHCKWLLLGFIHKVGVM